MRSICRPSGGRATLSAAAVAIALLLAACSAASPSAAPAGSQAASGRCGLTPDASSSTTMTISGTQFGDEITIAAAEAVTFTNEDSFGHVVAEGSGGVAIADACVDEPIAGGASLVVTFTEPGDYQITCTIHASMQTAIHVE